MHILHKIYHWFNAAIFPSRCVICHRLGEYLCREHKQFASPEKTLLPDNIRSLIVPVSYADPTAKALLDRYKYFGNTALVSPICDEIVSVFPDYLRNNNACLVPIPLHWRRQLWRGFNQSDVIASELSLRLNIPAYRLLRRTRYTEQQARLDQHNRKSNMKNAFEFCSGLQAKIRTKNTPIVLIDDVYTTGATMASAAVTLSQYGFTNVHACVFAQVNI